MEKITKFNIRVYALIINQGNLLILKEPYVDEILFKFPGGGLEYGESLIECLNRELQEELNLKLASHKHFYTQEDFVISKFRENEQILTIYYLAEIKNIEDLKILEPRIEKVIWQNINKLSSDMLNLPVDKIVVEKLTERNKTL